MQLDIMAEKLIDLGLTRKQAQVYVANMFMGPAPAKQIAEQAGLNRPTTYDMLEELARLGLVSKSNDSGKTVFIAGGIDGLRDMLRREAQTIEQRNRRLVELESELELLERPESQTAPVVRFVRGKEGVDAIWSYVIRKAKPGTEILGLTNHDEVLKVYPDHIKTNPSVRLEKQLHSKTFYSSQTTETPTDPSILKETQRLSDPLPGDVTLYDDKAVLLSYGQGKGGWTGIIIENKDIVETLRRLFKLAWYNTSKK